MKTFIENRSCFEKKEKHPFFRFLSQCDRLQSITDKTVFLFAQLAWAQNCPSWQLCLCLSFFLSVWVHVGFANPIELQKDWEPSGASCDLVLVEGNLHTVNSSTLVQVVLHTDTQAHCPSNWPIDANIWALKWVCVGVSACFSCLAITFSSKLSFLVALSNAPLRGLPSHSR